MLRILSSLHSIGLRAGVTLILLAAFPCPPSVAKEANLAAATALSAALASSPEKLVIQYQTDDGAETKPGATTGSLVLQGADAQQQILVTGVLSNDLRRDFTREVTFTAVPEGIVQVGKAGRITPLADGQTTLTAKSVNGLSVSLPITVEQAKTASPINFPNQIVPIFTKAGCNGGGCHGKSAGQNGFRLSLLGFEPTEDYEHLVKEARGRRIFPAAPTRSLLLVKGTAQLPHGGGKRLEAGSDDYKLLVRWITQGMPYGKPEDPKVTQIEVFPKERTMSFQSEQQLVVQARYSDGSTRDVTRSAVYDVNDKDVANVDEAGRLKVLEQPGAVAVMIRYQSQVAVFRATVPLGAPVDSIPTPKNFVDELVFQKLKTVGMPPSELCDDNTFLRRVTIDVAGRLPTPEEMKEFLADRSPLKRDQWIERLLDSPAYAEFFANKWSALLRNKRVEPSFAHGTYAFHDWIRDSFIENKPFDQFVREILAASGDIGQNPPVAWYRQEREMTTQLEDTAQLFLGQRLQCAQCHHHPYEKWSQHDYYSFAAFFSRVGRKGGTQPGEEIIFHKRGPASATNKKNQKSVRPAGLGAPEATLSPDDDPRQALVDWMTSKDNRFFARSLVNRYWKHFFNRGLVDPEDDLRETNPASNPELLDQLARKFIDSGFDLKQLVRTLCQSQVYQLSAVPNQFNGIDKQFFSRYYPKRLQAEVLLDAVNLVTRAESQFDGLPAGTPAVCLPDNSFNASTYFLQVFGRPESSSSCECERSQDASLAQSLHLLNSKDIQAKVSHDQGRAAKLAVEEQRSDEDKVRELYHWSYSREPDEKELAAAKEYLAKITARKDEKANALDQKKRQAYEDMVWALVNTKEFLFNH